MMLDHFVEMIFDPENYSCTTRIARSSTKALTRQQTSLKCADTEAIGDKIEDPPDTKDLCQMAEKS